MLKGIYTFTTEFITDERQTRSEEKINEIPKGTGILEFRTDGWNSFFFIFFRCVSCASTLLFTAFILPNFRNSFQTVKLKRMITLSDMK
jgi:hypothetical protein